jgi:hypothetical protein
MNCRQYEQLVAAYLDGDLAGALRLEFDAHRLKCPDCQQQLAIMEAVENTLANDDPTPPLSGTFTDRVMADIRNKRAVRRRMLPARVAIAGGMVVQAAAVLVFAILVAEQRPAPDQNTNLTRGTAVPTNNEPLQIVAADEVAWREIVLDKAEQRLTDMVAAGKTITGDVSLLSRYLEVPPALAEHTEDIATASPWQVLWETVAPPATQSASPSDDEFAL